MASTSALKLVAVAAMASNRIIGKEGQLPWHLPEDLKFFKALTTGHAVLMGRKTFESIGRPLPNRQNIILSKSLTSPPDGTILVSSAEEIFSPELDLKGKLYVIGGAKVYESLMSQTSEIFLSYIHEEYSGDTSFPHFEEAFGNYTVIEKFDLFEVRHYIRPTPL
jgi:dihydrofolate reductase